MKLDDYLALQLREALGSENKWFCSQHYGREVEEPEVLLRYYIEHGGAKHFREVYEAQHNPPTSQVA